MTETLLVRSVQYLKLTIIVCLILASFAGLGLPAAIIVYTGYRLLNFGLSYL